VEGNAEAEGDPALVNSDPYGKGWIFKIRISDPSQFEGLLDAAAYRELLG
jgi:glycine cleavage system H protein